LSFSKQNLRILTGLLTGHCTLRYHMGKLGLSDSVCRLCLEEEESPEHVMCNCEAVAVLKLKYLGRPLLSLSEFQSTSFSDILRFIKCLNILWISWLTEGQHNSIFLGRSASGPIGPPLFHFYFYLQLKTEKRMKSTEFHIAFSSNFTRFWTYNWRYLQFQSMDFDAR
jgi:hypothetical protein